MGSIWGNLVKLNHFVHFWAQMAHLASNGLKWPIWVQMGSNGTFGIKWAQMAHLGSNGLICVKSCPCGPIWDQMGSFVLNRVHVGCLCFKSCPWACLSDCAKYGTICAKGGVLGGALSGALSQKGK